MKGTVSLSNGSSGQKGNDDNDARGHASMYFMGPISSSYNQVDLYMA